MGFNDEVTGTIGYMFLEDDSVESGLARIAHAYPGLEVKLDYHHRMVGSTITITGSWMDVFSFLVAEYDECDADDALANVAALKPTFTD